MTTRLQKLFFDYQAWYRSKYLPSITDEDEADPGDVIADPLEGLEPVTPKALAGLEARFGRLPVAYTQLLERLGAGVVLCAAEDEPSESTLLAPAKIARAQKDLLSWLGPEAAARAKKEQRLEAKKLVPFLTTDGTTWAVLAAQKASDDRVYLTSHDWEQRDGFDLFAGPLSVEAFFEHFFACARKRDPLNGSYEHRGALLRRARRK